jgi:hypothetical protein
MARHWDRTKETLVPLTFYLPAGASAKYYALYAQDIVQIVFHNDSATTLTSAATVTNAGDTVATSSLLAGAAVEEGTIDTDYDDVAADATLTITAGNQPMSITVLLTSDWS